MKICRFRFPKPRHSVLTRLTVILIAITVLANAAIVLLWNYNVNDIVQEMALSHILDITKNSNSRFETEMSDLISRLETLAQEEPTRLFAAQPAAAREQLLQTLQNHHKLLSDKLNGLAVITPSEICSAGNSYFSKELISAPTIEAILSAGEKATIFNRFPQDDPRAGGIVSIGIAANPDNAAPYILIADIKSGFWTGYFGISNMNGILRTIIANNDTVMFSNEQRLSFASRQKLIETAKAQNKYNQFFDITLDGEPYTVLVRRLTRFPQWRNITFFPKDYVYRSYYKMLSLIPYLMALVIVLALTASIVVSVSVTKRFHRLSQKIEETDIVNTKPFALPPQKKNGDEIDMIEQKFLTLVSTISQQINQLSDMEKKEHEYEMQSLRAQINPHFTYNALHVIQTLAEMQKADNISEVTLALSNLLRYSATDIDQFVSLGDETRHVQNYVTIMQHKFLNKINLTIDIDPQLMECSMQKMLLQPIVENSIRHGLYDRPDNSILIKAYETDDGLCVKITDNGRGIAPEKLEALLTFEQDSGQHLGLKNVDRRIKLTFGGDYGLHIYSEPNVYTTVSIDIPLIQREALADEPDFNC